MNQAFLTQLKYFPLTEVNFQAKLKDYTSFGIGGPPEALVTVRTVSELQQLIVLANDYQQSVFVLGRGTNLLVRDKGMRGLVVRLAGEFSHLEVEGSFLRAGAACSISQLLRQSIIHSLSGLEFAVGIPGSVGGAAYMNAGSGQESIGSFIQEVELLLPDGSSAVRLRDRLSFSYRQSSFNPGEIITQVVFKLEKKEGREEILSRIRERFLYRAGHQPLQEKSAGCIFKNPAGDSAGRLIDQSGCKGLAVGDAQVSQIHANFIINKNQASCAEVLHLMDMVQRRVHQSSGVLLEPEVLVVGEK